MEQVWLSQLKKAAIIQQSRKSTTFLTNRSPILLFSPQSKVSPFGRLGSVHYFAGRAFHSHMRKTLAWQLHPALYFPSGFTAQKANKEENKVIIAHWLSRVKHYCVTLATQDLEFIYPISLIQGRTHSLCNTTLLSPSNKQYLQDNY